MPKSNTFKDFVADQLATVRCLVIKPMFGGFGLYAGTHFFGLIYKDRLYFKTDDESRPDYESRGMKYFRPNPKQSLKNYFEVPADILEDRDELATWAERACSS